MRTSASRPARCWRNSSERVTLYAALRGAAATARRSTASSTPSRNDVRQGYVSIEAAHQLYGAEFNADGRADQARSDALRRDMKRRGLPKDRPFAREGFFALRLPALRLPTLDPRAEPDIARCRGRGLGNFRCC